MTEYSQTGGVHEVLPPKNPQEVGASQPLSDFEKNLTPEEREMFLEYKEILTLLNDVVEHTVPHTVNFENEIIKIAEIFHRLGIPIDGIIKEFQSKHIADDLANVYLLEKIIGGDSNKTIAELEKRCRDMLGHEKYFPITWGSPQYEGVELVLFVVDWKIKKGDFVGAQEMVLRIPWTGAHSDLISQAFTNHDYFFDGYHAYAKALIEAGRNPLQGIESCDARQVRTMLNAAVQGYLERGDLDQAENICDLQKKWCADLQEGALNIIVQHNDVARTWDTSELGDAHNDAQKFFHEQYAFLRSIHALALKKHEKGIDCSEEMRQSMEIVRDVEGRVKGEDYLGNTALAYCAYDAALTYARLGLTIEAYSGIAVMLQYRGYFGNDEIPPLAHVYAALGDVDKTKKYAAIPSGPRTIRAVAEQAFLCGQDEVGNYFAALLANMWTRERGKKAERTYNSYVVKILKEYSRLRLFIGRRKNKKDVFSVADYEYMLEFNLNDENQRDKAEGCALEHVDAALLDIDSRHPSLSVDQKERVRSGAISALRKAQKDDVVVPSLTRLSRPFREKADLWRFVRFTGVTLEPALVQAAYGKVFERGIDSEAILNGIKDIQNSTHVPFDGRQYVPALERLYRSVLERIGKADSWQGTAHYLDCVKTLVDFTGVSPSPELISKIFKNILVELHDGASLWALVDYFKQTPLAWDAIDLDADSEIYESTRKMPSNDLQRKMWDILTRVGRVIPRAVDGKGWGDFDRSHYPNMPPYIYGVWFNDTPLVSDWFLKAIDNAYGKIQVDIGKKKPGSRAVLDRLTYGIIESWHLDLNTGELLGDLRAFVDRGISPKELSDLMYSYALVSQLYASMNMKGLSPAGEIRSGRDNQRIFTGSVVEYIDQLERQAGKLFGEVIGIPGLSYEHVMRLKEEWGSFDVIFTLAGKYAKGYKEGLSLFRDMLRAKLEGRWHEFRYDESDPIVARQLEGCTEEEKKGWIENSPRQKLSTVALEAIDTSTIAASVRNHILTSLDGNHICPDEYRDNNEHLFEKTIDLFFRAIIYEHRIPHAIFSFKDRIRSAIYEKKILPEILEKIGIASRPNDEGFDNEFSLAAEREISLLSAAVGTTLTRQQKTLLGHLHGARDWLKTRSTPERKLEDHDLYGVPLDPSLGDLEEIRKALETVELLVRLAQISGKDITSSILPPLIEEGRTDQLASSIEKLMKVFEGRQSPFVQDLKNIQALLAQRFSVGTVERLDLTIRESDDLKESLESGKYPIGASSCQNYESDAYYTKCLLARGGDADKKNYIIDKDDKTIVVENELKLVYVNNRVPAIFLEPTNYSGIRDRYDVTSDVYRYAQAKARRMSQRVKVLRGADEGEEGAILVTVRPSRNHYQYEDGKRGGPGHGGLGIREGEYTMWAVEVA